MLSAFIKNFRRTENSTAVESKNAEITLTDDAGVLTFLDSRKLLEPHMEKVENIFQTLSISREHFKLLYMPVIQKMALIAQHIPASENHHHAYLGGLLEHSLEVAVFAARLRQGVMIRGISEDKMAIVGEALSYAVITAALLHDIGKAVTDVQIANISKNTNYLPLIDTPKPGEKYRFRFRAEREYTDHQKANLQLAVSLMPPNGIRWLSQYTEINQNWSRALAGEYSDAGDIGRIVARADSTSTQRATISQAATGDSASHNPLSKLTPADAFVRILRTILENGKQQLPLNKRGAAAWVTNDHIYFVSKRVIDEVRKESERLGPAVSIPSDNSTLMTMLGDAKKLKLNDGKAIHYLMIRDGDWEVPMTMMAFDRGLLDPGNRLAVTENTLSVRETGEVIHSAEMQTETNKTPKNKDVTNNDAEKKDDTEKGNEPKTEQAEVEVEVEAEADENITVGDYSGTKNSFFSNYSEAELSDEPPGLAGIAPQTKRLHQATRQDKPSEQAGITPQDNYPSQPNEPLASTNIPAQIEGLKFGVGNQEQVTKENPKSDNFKNKNQVAINEHIKENTTTKEKRNNGHPKTKKEMGTHFTTWLKNHITINVNKINGVSSPLHIIEPNLLLMVSPAIFSKYLDENLSVYKEVLHGDNKETRRSLIKKIQFSAETELNYAKSFNGSKIIRMKITGNRHSGTVSGFILNQQSTKNVFGSVPIPQYNPHINLLTPVM